MKQKLSITTADMEVALTQRKSSPAYFRTHPVVVNRCAWMFGHEADLISVTEAGYCTEIEIKVSKSDFMADFRKKVSHDSAYIKYFYYAVPEYMAEYAMERLPEGAGLLVVYPMRPCGYVKIRKAAVARKGACKLTDKQLYDHQRLMAMRYWTRQESLRKYMWGQYVDTFNAERRKRR